MERILGLHHITAIAGNAKLNLDFYTKVLGLRLVKKTVNFDDPGTYHFYYGDDFKVEFPTRSSNMLTLKMVADELSERLWRIFRKDENNYRPLNDGTMEYAEKPDFQDLILFYEYFHAETGKGLGASHQTGWTGMMGILDDLI